MLAVKKGFPPNTKLKKSNRIFFVDIPIMYTLPK